MIPDPLPEIGSSYINDPEMIPAQPDPAIARPTIRAVDVGAMPEIKEPRNRIPTALTNTHLTKKNL
jgi:hypothetical protein